MPLKLIILFSFFATIHLSAQSPLGIWKNVDDEDGQDKSHIEIYEKDGMLYGKVVKLLPAATLTHCNNCKGDHKGKSLIGLDILWNLKKNKKVWDNGEILDPKNGKIYDCKIELDGHDKLKVRGFIGVSMFGRTQIWYRVK